MAAKKRRMVAFWLAALAATVIVVACRFSPAKSCKADVDCGSDGICNANTGSCYEKSCDSACTNGTSCVQGTCQAGPTFVLSAGPVPPRATPDLAGDTWHRDDLASVLVTSSAAGIDAGSVLVEVSGVLLDGGPSPWVPVGAAASTPCSVDAAYCGAAQIPLWLPEFDAYEGTVHVRITGSDQSGAAGEATLALDITRQRWVFDAGAPIHGSPVVSSGGVVYFATVGHGGAVFGLNSDGTLKHEWAGFGSVEASPALGAAPDDLLYVAGADAGVNAFLYALSSVDGGTVAKWGVTDTSPLTAPFTGALGVGTTDPGAGPFETAVAIVNVPGGLLRGLRPLADPVFQASQATTAGFQSQPAGMAFVQSEAFYGDTDGQLRALSHSATGWGLKSSWTPDIGLKRVGGSGQAVAGPVTDGTRLVSTVQSRGVAVVQTSDSTLLTSFPVSGATRAPGYPVLHASGAIAGMTLAAGPVLIQGSVETPGAPTHQAPTSAQITASPLLGDGDWMYTAAENGLLQAWHPSDLSPHWSKQLTGAVSASPNMACGPSPGAPGLLYVTTEAGYVYAVVVDSHGLDTSAPWPKYQHDARNTGNPATSRACGN